MKRASIARLCYFLLAACIPLSMLCVFPGAGLGVWLSRGSPAIRVLLRRIAPDFPAWPQLFAVQTMAALLLVCGTLYVVGAGSKWLSRPRFDWRLLFPVSVVAYALWGGLSYLWSSWPYGTRAAVVREAPACFLAFAAMILCRKPGRWFTMARLFAGSAFAAAVLQIIMFVDRASDRLPPPWEQTWQDPVMFGIPYVTAIVALVALVIALVAYFQWEDDEHRRYIRRLFFISLAVAAGAVLGLLVGLEGTARRLLWRATDLTAFRPPAVDYHRELREAFRFNPLFYSNVNFCVGAALTGIYVTVGFAAHRVVRLGRAVSTWHQARAAGTAQEERKPRELIAEPRTALLLVVAFIVVSTLAFLLVISGSLAGKVSLLVSATAFVLCMVPRRVRWIGAGLIVVPSVLAGVIIFAVPSMRQRAWERLTHERSTTHLRIVYWWAAGDMFLQKPLAGWGTGTFPTSYWQFRPPLASKLRYVRWVRATHPHNEYARVLCELGLIGMLFYLSALVFGFGVSYRALGRAPPRLRLVGFGLWSGALGYAVQATFAKAPMHWMVAANFWMLLGLLASSAHWSGSVEEPSEQGSEPADEPGNRPAPALETQADSNRLRITIEGWLALIIVAVLAGWAWWEWAVGAYASQIHMRKARAALRQMGNANLGWSRYESLRRHAADERPRCLWPTEHIHHHYALCGFLADKGYWPEVSRRGLEIERYAPEMLKARLLLSRSYAGMGNMVPAWEAAISYIGRSPYDLEGYERLSDFDMPMALFLFERHLREFEAPVRTLQRELSALKNLPGPEGEELDEIAAKIEELERHANNPRFAVARLLLDLDRQRPLFADPEQYLVDNPYSLKAHRVVQLRRDLGEKRGSEFLDKLRQQTAAYMGRDLKADAIEQLRRFVTYRPDFILYRPDGRLDDRLLLARAHPESAINLLERRLHYHRQAMAATQDELGKVPLPDNLPDLRGMVSQANRPRLEKQIGDAGLELKPTVRLLETLRNQRQAVLDALLALADARHRNGNDEEARRLMLSALRHDPSDVRGYGILASADLQTATRMLTEFVGRQGGNPARHRENAGAMMRLNAMQKQGLRLPAKERGRVSNAGYLAHLYLQLAEFHRRAGGKELMLSFATTAACLAPDRARAYELMAEADRSQAIAHLTAYVDLPVRPEVLPVEFHLQMRGLRRLLGKLFLDDGQREQAAFQLRGCQELTPQDLATYPLLYRADPAEATARLEGYAIEDAELGHVRALSLLVTFYARQERWRDLWDLVARATQEAGIRPFVLVVPAAARLDKSDEREPLGQLQAMFPDVFGDLPRPAEPDQPTP